MGVPERLGGQVWQRAQPDDFDEYTGYRLLYQVEKFSASWRNLVTFYLAMFIAGYAQVVERFLFWGAVAALLLVYWEPYLSPPFPWISGNSSSSSAADDLLPHTVQTWGNRPRWLPPPSTREKQAVRQWLYCVRQGYPQRQQLLHRLLQCVIVLPCASMGCGVMHQRLRRPDLDIKSTYSGLVLFVVVLVYTLLTVGSNLAFLFAVRRKLAPAAVAEDWQPQDMMFFTCKILGQFLNTIVQTLVAGAFVTYMPPTIFWLSVAVTAMSYTATNLLYDMGPGAPVQNEEVDSHWVTNWLTKNHTCGSATVAATDAPTNSSSMRLDNSYAVPNARGSSSAAKSCGVHAGQTQSLPVRRGIDSASSAYGTAAAAAAVTSSSDDVAVSLDCAEAANFTVNGKAARESSQCEVFKGRSEGSKRSDGNAGENSPPFLLYRRPKGLRGWSIIVLLILQVLPCIAILAMLTFGKYQQRPDVYLQEKPEGDKACVEMCARRYVQLLYALVCLGIISGYYAFTIAVPGCGPVTLVYRCLHHGCFKRASKPTL
uniref:Transmembrane protein n=1 Tax=Tetradesmus obliquus TaxID=3088 RepID=A0A383W2P9_TETOB|eukprot:jgi/Sobl393_1/19265/SZX70936.1